MLYGIVSIALLILSVSGFGHRQNRRVYAYENPNAYQSSSSYYGGGVDSGYNYGSSSDSGYYGGGGSGMSGDYNNYGSYDSYGSYGGSGGYYNPYGSGNIGSNYYNRLQSGYYGNSGGSNYYDPGYGSDSSYYDPGYYSSSQYNYPASDYDYTPSFSSSSAMRNFKQRYYNQMPKQFNTRSKPKPRPRPRSMARPVVRTVEQLTTPDEDLSSGYYDSLYNPATYDGTPAMPGPDVRKRYYSRRVRNYAETTTPSDSYQSNQPDQLDQPIVCKCNCGRNEDDDNNDCFEKRCISQYKSCKLNVECSSALSKAENGICETGQTDCSDADVMCQNGSNDCKSLWNNLLACFNSCDNQGQAAVDCVKSKCNTSGDIDSCNKVAACYNAIQNVKNGNCENDNYDCGDSNFMCNGDVDCIPIWNKIVNCYNSQCSNDSDDSNDSNDSSNRRNNMFVANKALKQSVTLQRSRLRRMRRKL